MKQRTNKWVIASGGILTAVLFGLPGVRSLAQPGAHAAASESAVAAGKAFAAMVPVLRNPRCMNCHMSGDYPRQGEDTHPHPMDVRRGTDGHGVNAVKCSTCHQDHNVAGIHTPPGAPGWGLPSPATPMIWEGLNDRQLCELLKDPDRNGHRSISQIEEHMRTPLVLWGWHPGEGRAPIPYSQKSFEQDVRVWAAGNGACPAEPANISAMTGRKGD